MKHSKLAKTYRCKGETLMNLNWRVTLLLAIFLLWASKNDNVSWANVISALLGMALFVVSLQQWQESKNKTKSKK
jgi:hypothetical protein